MPSIDKLEETIHVKPEQPTEELPKKRLVRVDDFRTLLISCPIADLI